MHIKHILILLSIFLQINLFAGIAQCYGVSKDSNRAWFISPDSGSSPLPSATEIAVDKPFNVGGSFYRVSNEKLYLFDCNDGSDCNLYAYSIDHLNSASTRESIKSNIIVGGWSEVVGATSHVDSVSGKEYLSAIVITSGAWIDFYQWDMDTLTLKAGMPIKISDNITLRSLAYDSKTDKFYVVGDDTITLKPTLYEVDLASNSTKNPIELEFPIDSGGLSFAGDGLLYVENDDAKHDGIRNLYSIDISNGDMLKAAIFGGNSDIDSLACNGGGRIDAGDAPSSYGIAAHKLPQISTQASKLYLGSKYGDDDHVLDQYSVEADKDGDDEDGVYVDSKSLSNQRLKIGEKVTLNIQTNGVEDGYLSGWIDFNRDGDFEDSGEKIIDNYLSSAKDTVTIVVDIPKDISKGDSYARFRYSTEQNLPPHDNLFSGEKVRDGEVEDYKIIFIDSFNFGENGEVIPIAKDDYKRNNQPISGTNPTVVDIFEDNGYGKDIDANNRLDPTSVKIVPIEGAVLSDDAKELDVPNEGIWVVNPDNGYITFLPDTNMKNDPTQIYYTVENEDKTKSNEAKVVVDYFPFIPFAKDDTVVGVVGKPTVIDVLKNDEKVSDDKALDPVSLQIVGTLNAGDSLIVINEGIWSVVAGTIIFTPLDTFVGEPTPIKYTIKDEDFTESNQAIVTIHYPITIRGTIWLDSDNSYDINDNEKRMEGWSVHIINEMGEIVSNIKTDKNGQYSVSNIFGGKYRVEFFNTYLDLMGVETTHDIKPSEVVVKDLPLHPTGVVYDALTRETIAGAKVSITDDKGTLLPSQCLLNLGQSQITRDDGFYWIDINFGADPSCPKSKSIYKIEITPPNGYIFPSSQINAQKEPFKSGTQERFCVVDKLLNNDSCQIQLQADAPLLEEDTTYFLNLEIAIGDMGIFNNHIPLDSGNVVESVDLAFVINKVSQKKEVSIGDFVPYSITVSNQSKFTKSDISVADNIPDGFSFVKKSAIIIRAGVDGVLNTQDDVKSKIEPTGSDPIIFEGIDFDSKESIKIDYLLQVGIGVAEGEHINEASVVDANGILVSNRTIATVRVISIPFMDNSLIIGKIFDDKNQNGIQDSCCEKGIAGVRIVGVDGMVIETDGYGRYHVSDDIKSLFGGRGRNIILKIDPTTLPNGTIILSENPRVYRVTSSGLNVVNFSVKLPQVEKFSREKIVFENDIKEERYIQKESIPIGSIYFDSDQNCIRPDQAKTIKKMAEKLKAYGGGELIIEGNTDARAPAWYNKKLAYKRAQSVYVALKCHLNDTQMQKVSVIYDDVDKEVKFNPKYDWWGKPNIPRTKKECTKLGLSNKACRDALKREGGA